MAELEYTTLRPNWRNRMVIITVVLLAFGSWGLLDAIWIYPARGEKVAELREFQHLAQVKEDRSGARLRAGDASIAEPAERLSSLRDIKRERTLEGREATAEAWLIALSRIGRLTPEFTTYTEDDPDRDPNTRLDTLQAKWDKTTDQPKPLSSYDIPVQWVIMAVAWGFALYCIYLMLKAKTKRWSFDPATKTLGMPDGTTISPEHLADVDKRKWSKFYVTLVLKPDHPTLANQSLDVDLFRRDKIESWVLAMEAEAFPERTEEHSGTPTDDGTSASERSAAADETDSDD